MSAGAATAGAGGLERLPGTIGLEVSSLLVGSPSGIGVFGASLIEKLQDLLGDHALGLVTRVSRFRRRRFAPGRGLSLVPYVNGALLHRRFPLLHALDTRFPPRYQGRLVATLFDVLSALPLGVELELSPPEFRVHKLGQYRRIAERAQLVVTISEETRQRFLERFDVAGEVHVVYPGVDPAFVPAAADPAELERFGLRGLPYVVAVGELCTRKNLDGIVETFDRVRPAHPELRLVLVGRPSFGWQESAARRRILAAPDRIRLLGFVSRRALAALYAGAAAFLYLSHYEGFGLPVLEAMASGLPVVASNRGGIPEAAGSAARLVDPLDPEMSAAALRRVLEDRAEALRLRQAGIEQARRFSWERCARQVVELYQKALRT